MSRSSPSNLFVPLVPIPPHLQKELDRCSGCDGRGYMIVMLGGPGRRTQCDRCLRFRKREGLPIWTNAEVSHGDGSATPQTLKP